MRPNAQLAEDIALAKKRLRWGWFKKHTGIIGMHVRRGDACDGDVRKGRTCSPLSVYMAEALEMKRRYGVSAVFLASDSQQVIEHSRRYEKHFDILSIDGRHKSAASSSKMTWDQILGRKDTAVHPTSVAREVILDMLLLSETDMLVIIIGMNGHVYIYTWCIIYIHIHIHHKCESRMHHMSIRIIYMFHNI
jgi:hypothetical protein